MRKKEAIIYKVQRPIIATGDYEVLCYNEDKTITGQFPPAKELLDMFDDDEYKIYVFGDYGEKTGKIIIVDKLPTQAVIDAEMGF